MNADLRGKDAVHEQRRERRAFPNAYYTKPYKYKTHSLKAKKSTSPLHFIIVNDELFLQNFDRIEVVCLLLFRQHNLSEVTLTQHGKKIEIVQTNFPSSFLRSYNLLLQMLL